MPVHVDITTFSQCTSEMVVPAVVCLHVMMYRGMETESPTTGRIWPSTERICNKTVMVCSATEKACPTTGCGTEGVYTTSKIVYPDSERVYLTTTRIIPKQAKQPDYPPNTLILCGILGATASGV